MKLGINGDSSTKLTNLQPVSMTSKNKDASDMMGSGTGTNVTYEQVINIFNTYIQNTNLASLIDVNDDLGLAPENSIFIKKSNQWTYEELSQ